MTNRYKFRSLWQYSPPDIVNPLSVSVQASGKKRLILNLRHNNFHTFKQQFKCERLHTTITRLNEVRIQIYTRYCGKPTSKLSKHAFEVTYNFFSLSFPDWTDVFLHQSSIEVNNTFRKITECFLKKKLPRQSLNLNSWVGGNINQIQLKSQKNLPQFNVCIEIAYLRNTLSFDQE